MKIHSFNESLNQANSIDDSFWLEIYKKHFRDFSAMVSHSGDGYWQRLGIDRTIVLKTGQIFYVDEKIRYTEYNDILLEIWSSLEDRIEGWIEKDLLADYIAYAFKKSGRCYFLPVIPLKKVWRDNGEKWFDIYPKPEAVNSQYGRKWTTTSIAIPIDVLFTAIMNSYKIEPNLLNQKRRTA